MIPGQNPYQASAASNDTAVADHRTDSDRRYRAWFVITLVVMAGINLLPLYSTWRAIELDGERCMGWPFTFSRYGGTGVPFNVHHLDLHHLLVDVVIAVGAALLVAYALRDGWLAFLRRFRRLPTWGVGK